MQTYSLRFARLIRLALVAAATTGVVSLSLTKADDDDDEEREIRRQIGQQAFVENCLMCHGEEMTTRQRLTTKQWTAEVEKMVGWGSPLPPDRKQPLIDHLSETYPNTKVAPRPERITADRALELDHQPVIKPLPGADLARGEALFTTHCAVCHASNARGGDLGTNLVEKPVLLRVDEFRVLMKDGRRRMPGFASILDEPKQSDLLAWLRRQR